jgi:hypothetical protein
MWRFGDGLIWRFGGGLIWRFEDGLIWRFGGGLIWRFGDGLIWRFEDGLISRVGFKFDTMQGNKEKNLIVDLTFDFAISIIKYAELLEEKRRFVLARQLLKSGTSIGANVREAQKLKAKRILFIK